MCFANFLPLIKATAKVTRQMLIGGKGKRHEDEVETGENKLTSACFLPDKWEKTKRSTCGAIITFLA